MRFSPPPEVVLLASCRFLRSRGTLLAEIKNLDASFQNKKLEKQVFVLCLLVNGKIQHLLSINNRLSTLNDYCAASVKLR